MRPDGTKLGKSGHKPDFFLKMNKSEIDALIDREPTAFVKGLIKASKTGVLIVHTSVGELRFGVVTLRKRGGKVEIIPVGR